MQELLTSGRILSDSQRRDSVADVDEIRPNPMHPKIRVITSSRPTFGESLRGLVEDWSFVVYLTKRDWLQNYGASNLGLLWAGLRPFGLMLVFTVFFSLWGRAPMKGGVPFPLFVLCGLVTWQFIEKVVWTSINGMPRHRQLVGKIAFSRFAIPIATVISRSFELLTSLFVLFIALFAFGVPITWKLLFALAVIPSLVAFAMALGISLCLLGLCFENAKHFSQFLVRGWFFLSPIFYDHQLFIPARFDWIYRLNPLATFIESMRWSFLGYGAPRLDAFLVTTAASLGLLLLSVYLFHTKQYKMSDLLS